MFRRVRDMSRGFTGGAAAGAVLAYFFDPDRGRTRRAKTRGRLAARGRKVARTTGTRTRYMEGQVEGLKYRLTLKPDAGDGEPMTSQMLADKVRSEVLGKEPFRSHAITVDVEEGIVHLRGEINRPEVVRALRAEVERLADVERVESLLHPPGTPAPNKQEARQAS